MTFLCSFCYRLLKIHNPLMSRIHFSSLSLTSEKYPHVKRGTYSIVNDKDISVFERIVGSQHVITDESDILGHNIDWIKSVRGASKILLKPSETGEVSEILRYCNEKILAVCPQGGNTGLVAGSVPVFDEIILSVSRMNKILYFDELSGILVCQAGCILETLDDYVGQHGMMVPLDLASKGSCHIGGNISTNAGGMRLFRYGNLHGTVAGVEAVLASGGVIDCLSTQKKDNTGYHLKHLFIGSEGTLGIVTKVAIHCPTRPAASTVLFLGIDTFENVLKTYSEAKQSLGEILSSCEFLDDSSADCVVNNLNLKVPIGRCNFYILIETSGSNQQHDEDKVSSFLDKILTSGFVKDGTMANEPSRVKNIWQVRERITEALLLDGYSYKHDISLPLNRFYDIVLDMRNRLGDSVVRCCGYGHLGDGNLHLNVTSRQYDSHVSQLIEPYVYEWTAKVGGSISAEHGIGFKKRDYVHFSKSPAAISVMKQLKETFDPNRILNPYKLLPQ